MAIPDYSIVIPARYGSTRFPGKPLHPLKGRAMVLHVIDRARETAARDVIVATDDDRIADVCQSENIAVEMTLREHPSGTDRIAEVAARRDWADDHIIVGLQGDEPATLPAHLDLLAQNLQLFPDADMATLCTRLNNREDYQNPDRVKVVVDHRGMALYFSRASIPASRDYLASDTLPRSFMHIGLYAYRRAFLDRYQDMSPCELENLEQLEQLRVLYHGGRIHVAEVSDHATHGVDRPEDALAVESFLPEATMQDK